MLRLRCAGSSLSTGQRGSDPEEANQIWMHYSCPAVDLYASKKNTQCPKFFSLSDRDALWAWPVRGWTWMWLAFHRASLQPFKMLQPHLPGHFMTANGVCLKSGAWRHRRYNFNALCLSSSAFLQDFLDRGRAFFAVKVYLGAIAACHVGFHGQPVREHPLISRFTRGHTTCI